MNATSTITSVSPMTTVLPSAGTHSSSSKHCIRTFDFYDSCGSRFRAAMCIIPLYISQMDYKFGVVYPHINIKSSERKLFSLLATEVRGLPSLPTRQFYMRIREKRELTPDRQVVEGIQHEFLETMGQIIPMTLRAEQEIDMGDESICYDEINVQLLIEQGIIRVLSTVTRNRKWKLVKAEMLMGSDEMLRWCQGCSHAEDMTNLAVRFKGCARCQDYQMAYYCSKECQSLSWDGVSGMLTHKEYCGKDGKFTKKLLRGANFKISDEEEQEMWIWMVSKHQETIGVVP